jgi:hypothetical protein
MSSFSNIHLQLKDQCAVMDVAELTKAHVAQLYFLRALLYNLPSLSHLVIA